MTQEELLQIESSQRQHFEVMLQQDRQSIIVEQLEYNLFSIIKPKLYKDGDSWCCLFGDDINVGICGFGDTPYLAILDWNRAWNNQ